MENGNNTQRTDLLISVGQLKATDVCCDQCPRTARYIVQVWDETNWACKRHCVSAMNEAIVAVERLRSVG